MEIKKVLMPLMACMLLLAGFISSTRFIKDEIISNDELKNRVDTFNKWYRGFNPDSKVEGRLTTDMRIGLFAAQELKVSWSIMI